MWTDAICINQADDDEKMVQVQQMDKIYGKADSVFIWLGRKHKHRDIAVSLMEAWPPYPESPESANIKFHGKTYRTAKEFVLKTGSGCELMSWMILMVIVSEGWFQRVWTLQEFILAKQYAFFYDGNAIPTAAVKSAMSWVYFLLSMGPAPVLPSWMHFQPSIFTLKQQLDESNQKLDFSEAVLLGGTRLATNPRDKIFGLLSITDPASLQPSQLPPADVNYDVAMKDLYVDIALRLLHGKAGLSMLSLVNHPLDKAAYKGTYKTQFQKTKPIGNRIIDHYRGKSRGWSKETRSIILPEEDIFSPDLQPDWDGIRTDAFPSWVPKLVSSIGCKPFFQRAKDGQSVFKAAQSTPPSFCTSANGRVLSVSAKPFDTIKAVASLPQNDTELHLHERSEKAQRTELWTLATSLVNTKQGGNPTYAPTGEATVSVIWRTLLTNLWNRQHPAPNYVEAFFLSWLAKASMKTDVRRGLGLEREPEACDHRIFWIALEDVGMDRKVFVTERGYVGLGPPTARVGDAVVLVAGAYAPFVLRAHNARGNAWLLVGEAFSQCCYGSTDIQPYGRKRGNP
ncbi:Heterokaryon incompatibility protein or allele [Neofusicoccum parvum]|nr:Heterokaryon incompatibility protein or allele [Neofusicoccum parvum]